MKRWFAQRKVTVILTVLLTISLAINVTAAGTLTQITAHLNSGIKLILNGKEFAPMDPATKTKYVPITYQGRTYLPMRAVAEAVGLEVLWDANTNTATLGEQGGDIANDQINWVSVKDFSSHIDYYRTKARHPKLLTYDNGKIFDYGYADEPGLSSGMSLWVENNYVYDKFKATFWINEEKYEDENGTMHYDNFDAELIFTDENQSPVHSVAVEYGKVYEVELDIKEIKELEIWARGSLSIIGEPMIGK